VHDLTHLGELLDEPLGARVPEQGDVRREHAVALRQPLVVLVVEFGVEVLVVLFHGYDASCQAFGHVDLVEALQDKPGVALRARGRGRVSEALRRFISPSFEWMEQ
jgi:hypothetical protein